LLGAACVIVGDRIPELRAQAKTVDFEVIDLRKGATLAQQNEQIEGISGIQMRGGVVFVKSTTRS
jgi:glutathione-independent formaldehyde dehydrogenase